MIAGLRPDDLRPGRDDPSAPRLRAELEVVERLGTESHLIFPVDAQKPAGEAAAAADEATEDERRDAARRRQPRALHRRRRGAAAASSRARRSSSSCRPDALHLFDPETARRFGERDPAARGPVGYEQACAVSGRRRRSVPGITGACTRSLAACARRMGGRALACSLTPRRRLAPYELGTRRSRRAPRAAARGSRAGARRTPHCCRGCRPSRRARYLDDEPARRPPVGPRRAVATSARWPGAARRPAVPPGEARAGRALLPRGGLLAAPAAQPLRRPRRPPVVRRTTFVTPTTVGLIDPCDDPSPARLRARLQRCARWTCRSGWRRSSPLGDSRSSASWT